MGEKLFGRISHRLVIRTIWGAFLAGVVFIAALFVFVTNTKMPDTSELENPEFEESSIVYSNDMVEIDRYFRKNRQWVQFEDLNPHLVEGLIATEDHRYRNHSGIDAYGLARAIFLLGSRGGASTITQQLANQFYTPRRSKNPLKRIWQKMKEWVIAVEFERRYTKEEIIAMLLNKFDFLHQSNGVSSAANVYFGKDQSELTLPEAATLVGMLNNPSLFSPTRFPDRSTRRRNIVMSQMVRNGYLEQAAYDSLKVVEMDMSQFNKADNYNGLAPHFMAELKEHLKQLIRNEGLTKPGDEPFDLDSDGLIIHTTIDSRYQKHAEAAMRVHMKNQQEIFFKTWKNKDPWTYLDSKASNRERQLRIRDNQITRQIEITDTYKNLRKEHLGEIIKRINSKIDGARLWNGDINRLLNARNDKGYLNELLKQGYIREDQKATYLKVLKLPEFKTLVAQWNKLKKKVTTVMNTEKDMTVYSYDGPVDMTMTPIDSIKYMNMFLQLGSVSIEPSTGYVRTWVGGTDYNIWQFDHVTTNRQVGSTFKPFLYTAALINGISPCYKIKDTQYSIAANDPNFGLQESWEPENSRGTFSEEDITLKDALKESLNSASVWLVKELGSVQPIIDVATSMGIKKQKIPPYPSIVLGTPEVSVLELTSAYATFANNGIKTKPIFIKRIKYNGVTIWENQIEQNRALTEDYNHAMVELLKHAASSRAFALKTEFGGKTGTTNDHVDGWFVGVTPNLVTGTWVGGDQPWIRYRSLDQGQGGQMARPFFLDYMQRIEADEEIGYNTSAKFFRPANPAFITDCAAYEALYETTKKKDDLGDEFNDDIN